MTTDIKIQFYCKPYLLSNERFYKPTPEECEVINKFYDYSPVIDSKNSTPSLNHLQGFYWNLGDLDLSDCADHRCEYCFLVIYFQTPVTTAEFDGYRKSFSDILGLDCRATKSKPDIPTKKPQLPFVSTQYVPFDDTTEIDGREYNVTRMVETDIENQERINLLISILQDDKHLIQTEDTVPQLDP